MQELVMPVRTGSTLAPSHRFVLKAERWSEALGHENYGFLSWQHGFVPRRDPQLELPASHRPWDQLASELPRLYREQRVRQRIRSLPLLGAGPAELPDSALLRAAAVVAILAHAYWYSSPTPVSELPPALALPWATLRARLGREHEVISYIDLVVYNFRRKDPAGPLEVANLELLLPTIGNEEEQVFYLTQLEILARASQLLRTALCIQDSVVREDSRSVTELCLRLPLELERIVAQALPKISPLARHRHFVDAVTWAKSVAPFAVPFRAGVLGPSGTSSPIFNTLDVFFGRKRHESFLGREIRELQRIYPPFWRGLLARLGQVDVSAYVACVAEPALSEAWQGALQAYAGERGFLGRHRAKVYGFLELAFKVGRSVTIGGFSGVFEDRTWDEVDDALRASRQERFAAAPESAASAPTTSPESGRPEDSPRHPLAAGANPQDDANAASARAFTPAEVARHNRPETGVWIIVDQQVYDVTQFRSLHPGGHRILDAYAGMDASRGFARAHADRSVVAPLLARYHLGSVATPRFNLASQGGAGLVDPASSGAFERGYRLYVRALNLVVEMENALAIDLSLEHLAVHPEWPAHDITPYKLVQLAQCHERFLRTYLPPLLREALPNLLASARAIFALAGAPEAGAFGLADLADRDEPGLGVPAAAHPVVSSSRVGGSAGDWPESSAAVASQLLSRAVAAAEAEGLDLGERACLLQLGPLDQRLLRELKLTMASLVEAFFAPGDRLERLSRGTARVAGLLGDYQKELLTLEMQLASVSPSFG